MHIAPRKITEHFPRFFIKPVTGGRIRREDWYRADVTQRWNSSDVNLARMSSGIEEIIFIFFSGRHIAGQRIRSAFGLRSACLFSATRQTKRGSECDCIQYNSWLHKRIFPPNGYCFTVMTPLVPCE